MKRFFAKGLVALLPLVLTAVVLWYVVGFLWGNVGVPLGELFKGAMGKLAGWDPEADGHSWFFRWGAPIFGFAVGIVLTLILGFFVATFLGKKLFQLFERLLKRLPVIRTVYPYAKQFTDFFFAEGEKKMEFKSAVAVPYPCPGVYSIGFVTGEGLRSLNEALQKHLVCVFIPAAPTPVSGFVAYVPRENVIPLPISVEEAMRIIISAGVLHPEHQRVGTGFLTPAAPAPLPIPPELAQAIGDKAKNAAP